jgi:P27 family predicted phage terminase small subunit
MKGRKPKPASIKLIEGSKYTKDVPQPRDPQSLYCPHWLPKYGKYFWRKYAGELQKLGLLSVLDVPAFEVLCFLYDIMRKSYESLRTDGPITIDERKLPRKSPAFSIFASAVKEFRSWSTEFGMTPSSRQRVDMNSLKDVEVEWDELLN